MGGAVAGGNVTPAAEFNIWADPEAAHRLFQSGLDVTMIGLDVTHKALLTPAHADRLRESSRHGRPRRRALRPLPPLPRQAVRLPRLACARCRRGRARPPRRSRGTVDRAVVVDCGGELSRGRTYVDLWRRMDWPVNAHVGVGIDGEAFLELLLERIASLG